MSATMFGGKARLCCPSCGDTGELMTEETVTVRFSARFSAPVGDTFSRDAGDAPEYTGRRQETLDAEGTWHGEVHCFGCGWAGHYSDLPVPDGRRRS